MDDNVLIMLLLNSLSRQGDSRAPLKQKNASRTSNTRALPLGRACMFMFVNFSCRIAPRE